VSPADARRLADVAELLVWLACRRPPSLGSGRLICVDGPSGSGKSTLGAALLHAAAPQGSTRLLHTDDMLDGWSGLPSLPGTIADDLIAPLGAGRPGSYRRYDWHAARFAETHEVKPVDLLIIEGVGSAGVRYADATTLLVWMEAPADVCLERGVARDGEAMRARLQQWRRDEADLFRRERTADRADVLVDGTGAADEAVVLR
jgi:uridine kinase